MKPNIYKKPLYLNRQQRRLNPSCRSDVPQEYASDAWVPKMIVFSFDTAANSLEITINYDPRYEDEQKDFLTSKDLDISICYGLNTKRIFQIIIANIAANDFTKEIPHIQELLKELAVE